MRNTLIFLTVLFVATGVALGTSICLAGLDMSLTPEFSEASKGVPFAGYAVLENTGPVGVVLENGLSIKDGGVEYRITDPEGETILVNKWTIDTVYCGGEVKAIELAPGGKVFWPIFLAGFNGELFFKSPGEYIVECRVLNGEKSYSCRESYVVVDDGGDLAEWESIFPFVSMFQPFGFMAYPYSIMQQRAIAAGGNYGSPGMIVGAYPSVSPT